MTTAPAAEWRAAPRTGLDVLHALVTDPPPPTSRALWDLMHRAFPDAARQLAHPHGTLRTSAVPRADLTDRDLERLALAWRLTATEILEDVYRPLVLSPYTMRALAMGAPNPVHGLERPYLNAAVSRRLLILGFEPNEVAERRITYAAVDAIRDALSRLTP